MILCVLLNIGTFVAYKLHMIKADINGNTFDDIERKLLIYALATFLGHLLFANLFLIADVINIIDPTIMVVTLIYYPLVMDTGSVE
uniref:Serpentine receptor class gamma n=1 Tax=Globodera pallida TaxID=36090 RepID=A0A183BZ50_GLOPA